MKQILILISFLLMFVTSLQSKVFVDFKPIQLNSFEQNDQQLLSQKIKSLLEKQFNLKLIDKDLSFIEVKNSLLGVNYKYQHKVQGVDVFGSELYFSINKNNQIFKVFSSIQDNPKILKNKIIAKISHVQASEIAFDSFGGYAKFLDTPKSKLVISDGVLIYKVIMSVENPRGDFEIDIEASSGKILYKNDVRIFRHHKSLPTSRVLKGKIKISYEKALINIMSQTMINLILKKNTTRRIGKGQSQVFMPNPTTTLKDGSLQDKTQAYVFKPAYRKVELKNLTIKNGVYHLESNLVELTNFESPNTAVSTSQSGDFTSERNQSNFTDSMTYYHLYDSIEYLLKLGFDGNKKVFTSAMTADSDAVFGQDNSYYSPASNALAFGHGCVDDNEDSDVILHELGHAINANINSSWRGGDTGAMGEGFGDYWAASYSYLQENGDFKSGWVFKWDGHNDCWGGRNVDKVDLVYDHNKRYDAHTRISGGITDELWSTPVFQAFKEMVDNGVDPDKLQQIIIESQFGMGSNLKMRDWANSIVQTAKTLFPKEKYFEVYKKYFKAQKILR